MTNRLPIPGSDDGNWGDILNDFLEVSLYNNLNNGSDPNNGTLNSGVVGTSTIANNAVTNAQLDSPTQTTLAAVASKYTKPGSGIPSSDMTTAVQTNLTEAGTAFQPTTTLSGDLSGTLPSPTVAKLQGINLTSTGASNGQVLTYESSGNQWVPSTVSSSTISDATSSSKGIIELAGDLAPGTNGAANPTLASTTNVNSIISSNTTVAGAVQKTNNLSDLSSASSARTNLGLGTASTISSTAGGDLSGTLPSPTVAKLQGTTISTPTGGATSYLNATGTWTTPAGGGSTNATSIDGVTVTGTPSTNQVLTATGATAANWQTPAAASNATSSTPGLVQLAGDLSPGTNGAVNPTVTSIKGITLPSSSPSSGNVLTATGATTTSWTTPAAGVTLDSTATDIQPLGTRSAGTLSTASKADHVHAMPTASQVGALPSTDDLSAIATSNPTAANVSLNSFKLTNIANGTASTDAAAYGQIPIAGTTSGTYAAGNDSRFANATQAMTPLSSPVTSAYTANPGDIVQVNAAGGAVVVKLPNAPVDKSKVTVKLISGTSVTNVATIQTQGSDVFDVSSGATAATLILQNQAKTYQYQLSSGIWYGLGADFPLASLVTGTSHTVTTAYTLTGSDHVVLADATSAAFTVTLPTAVGFSGRYTIDAISTGNNIVTLATTSSQTIDGSSTTTLGTQASGAYWSSVDLISDGSNWRSI
jgi:hypothetical protein